MVWKGLIFCLLVGSAVSEAAPRVKRTFDSLFSSSSSEPKKPLPVYKVHRYSGIYLVPVDAKNVHDTNNDNEKLPPVPSFVELPEDQDEDDYYDPPETAFETLSSLVPLGSGLISGVLSSSGGGFRRRQVKKLEDRIGIAATKDWIKSLPGKKKEFVFNTLTGALEKVSNKGARVKGLIKGAFTGPKTSVMSSGVYKYVPYDDNRSIWSKIPLVGRFFRTEIPLEIPDVGLPYIPNLAAFQDAPGLPVINIKGHYKLPFKTSAYVKIKVPRKNKYDIPSTSYGEPEGPIYLPDAPVDIEDNEPNALSLAATQKPSLPQPTLVQTTPITPAFVPDSPSEVLPQKPLPELNAQPPAIPNRFPPMNQYMSAQNQGQPQPMYPPFPFPQNSFNYPPNYPPNMLYNQGAASEHHRTTVEPERPVYRSQEEPKDATIAENRQEQQSGKKADTLPSDNSGVDGIQLEDGDMLVKDRMGNQEMAEDIPEDGTEINVSL